MELTDLHKLFSPKIMTNKYTTYREYEPTHALKPYIHCFWSSEAGKYPTSSRYTDTVIPDGCSDIIVEYNTVTKEFDMVYCGIFDHYFQTGVAYNPYRAYFGIRFFPGGALPFLDHNQKEFSNDIMDISVINGSFAKLIGEKLVHASYNAERVQMAESFLLKKLSNKIGKTISNSVLNNMLYRIFRSHGNISVHQLCSMEYTDMRTANRLFDRWIGLSPKKFSQIVRFQLTVQAVVNKTDPLSVVNQFGYYDQAHFIKDFKKRLGETPSAVKLSDFYNTENEK
ncbi:DUF6597 domain-containing transcriptional factor [Virgibacillus kimchii]